ncbi:MAG: serine/threonine-protein kinase [Planctomycetaceae bacterium]
MTAADRDENSSEFDADLAGFGVPSPRHADVGRDDFEQLASRLAEGMRRGKPSAGETNAVDPALAERLQEIAPVIAALESWKLAKAAECGGGELPATLSTDRLGEYRLIREIGRGGNAIVFEARPPSGRHVALKVYPRRGRTDAPLRLRFLDEAITMSRLRHPHVVPVHDVAEDAGYPYYVMRLAEGGSLDRLIDGLRRPGRRAAVTPERVQSPAAGREDWRCFAAIGVQVARAIAFAHASGVLHGDVKPANVLLDEAGDVLVADFGPSTRPEPDRRGRLTGTYRYMAPERFDGRCDERSDVYALGATLYELVALVPAFQAEGEDSLVRSILKHELVAPRFIRSNVPPELNAVIVKAMARDPAERYSTVADLVADLLNFLRGHPVSAGDEERFGARWLRLLRRRARGRSDT